ncbi:MAG: hypothetical protein WC683_04255 [bacterium]
MSSTLLTRAGPFTIETGTMGWHIYPSDLSRKVSARNMEKIARLIVDTLNAAYRKEKRGRKP